MSSPRRFPSKEAREADRKLREQGWEFIGRDGRNHLAYVHPSGARITSPGSPSDHRSTINLLATAGRRVAEEEAKNDQQPRVGRGSTRR